MNNTSMIIQNPSYLILFKTKQLGFLLINQHTHQANGFV